MSDKKNSNVYLIGGLAGALLGVGIAHVLLKTSEEDKTSLQITPEKGVQIGITTVGFLRNLLDLLK